MTPRVWQKSVLLGHRYKKGVGVCSSAHPGRIGLRIAPPHRIDNTVSPRQYELYINKVYRNAPRRRFGCHLSVVDNEFAKFMRHNDRRSKTSSSYIWPPATLSGLTERRCKDKTKNQNRQGIRRKKCFT